MSIDLNSVTILNIHNVDNYGIITELAKVSNGCHNVLIMSIDLNSVTILNIHNVDNYGIITELAKVKP